MSPEMVCNSDNYRHNILSFYYYFILINSFLIFNFKKNLSVYLFGCVLVVAHRDLLLWCKDSLVVTHGLSCSMTCGIFIPGPGMKPTSPALQGKFLTTGPLDKGSP